MSIRSNDPVLEPLLRLPVEDRRDAARILIASLTVDESAPLNPEIMALLDQDLADLNRNPEAGTDWEQVQSELEAILRTNLAK